MTRGPQRWLPPIIGSAVLILHVSLMYKAVLRHTGGVVSYPVDDAFIHLALAKHLVTDGTYGVFAHEFAAASSSIGWPLLVAFAMKVAGVSAWIPLVLNVGLGVGLMFVLDWACRALAPDVSTLGRTLVAGAVYALTPMPTLAVLGMEHTAHAACTIGFIATASVWLAEPNKKLWPVLLWAAGTTLWRYEGLFPIAIVVALVLAQKKFKAAAAIAAGGGLPVVLFGIYSKMHGAHFLPTSVLLKGRKIDLSSASSFVDLFGGDILDRLGAEGNSHVLVIGIATAAFAWFAIRQGGLFSARALALIITFGCTVAHVNLASIGWFFRYESYLLATGVAFVAIAFAEAITELRFRKNVYTAISLAVALLVTAAPLARRSIKADESTPIACRNIFEQQGNTARFLAAHFPGERVAVNDIGAVAWAGNERVVDLIGLGSPAVAEAKGLRLEKPIGQADFLRLTDGVEVAIIYDEWFKDYLPPTWIRVGKWKIDANKSCAFPSVSIYATNPEHYASVVNALRMFGRTMPRGIDQSGRYLDRPFDTTHIQDGDRILVDKTLRVVEDDGTVLLPSQQPKPLPIFVRGLESGKQQAILYRAPDQRRVDVDLTLVARRPATTLIGGAVQKAGELGPGPIDDLVKAAGGAAAAKPWLWRETKAGFTKMSRAETDTAVDGDIVVVP